VVAFLLRLRRLLLPGLGLLLFVFDNGSFFIVFVDHVVLVRVDVFAQRFDGVDVVIPQNADESLAARQWSSREGLAEVLVLKSLSAEVLYADVFAESHRNDPYLLANEGI
jgi:hypothetical protein